MKATLVLLYLSIIALPVFCFAQSRNSDTTFQYKIGMGGFYIDHANYFLTISYNHILKTKNEIEYPLYYNKYSSASEVISGISFNYSAIKKESIFKLFLSSEFNLNYYWYRNVFNAKTASSYGPFVYLGIIPSINFSPRISLTGELKLGYSYQVHHNFYAREAVLDQYEKQESGFKLIDVFKLYYHF